MKNMIQNWHTQLVFRLCKIKQRRKMCLGFSSAQHHHEFSPFSLSVIHTTYLWCNVWYWVKVVIEFSAVCSTKVKKIVDKFEFFDMPRLHFLAGTPVALICYFKSDHLASHSLFWILKLPNIVMNFHPSWLFIQHTWCTPSPWLTRIRFTRISLTRIFKTFPFLT